MIWRGYFIEYEVQLLFAIARSQIASGTSDRLFNKPLGPSDSSLSIYPFLLIVQYLDQTVITRVKTDSE